MTPPGGTASVLSHFSPSYPASLLGRCSRNQRLAPDASGSSRVPSAPGSVRSPSGQEFQGRPRKTRSPRRCAPTLPYVPNYLTCPFVSPSLCLPSLVVPVGDGLPETVGVGLGFVSVALSAA